MKKNILYLSLTGMTEPLGRSQVLEYLFDLSKENKISLISFEREKDLKNIEDINKLVQEHNIEWSYFIYSNKYGLFSSIWQILQGILTSGHIIKNYNIDIIHSRSFIPTVIAYLLKKFYKVKLLFDIRGFSIDEKPDRGRLKKKSLLFKALKYVDNLLYKESDYIVTLTHKAKDILNKRNNIPFNKIEVIPTCANKNVFKIIDKKEKVEIRKSLGYEENDIILIHTGTVGGWYDFDSELKVVKYLMEQSSNIHFLIVNKNEKDLIMVNIKKQKIDEKRIKIISSPFEEMYKYLNIANFSIFFIKPSFSKQASAPTKFAENISCYLPSITNKGVGDMEFYLTQYNVGVIVDLDKLNNNFTSEIEKIYFEMKNIKIEKKEYDRLFYEYFDKEIAVNKYNKIYRELL